MERISTGSFTQAFSVRLFAGAVGVNIRMS